MSRKINVDEQINGMSIARFIASKILTNVKYNDIEYYELEDKLTNEIDIAFTEIMIFQENPKPLVEDETPSQDEPIKEIVYGRTFAKSVAIKAIKYDEKVNENNIKTFEKYGVFRRNEDDIYTCVLCGRKTSINCSTSLRGHKLICCGCVYDVFDNYANAIEWQEDREGYLKYTR